MHPPESTCVHLFPPTSCPPSSTYAHLCPHASSWGRLCPPMSTCVNLHPALSTCVHLHPHASTCIFWQIIFSFGTFKQATFGNLCQLLAIIDLLSATLQFLAMFGNFRQLLPCHHATISSCHHVDKHQQQSL